MSNKTKGKIARAIFGLSFLFILGVVGGMEHFTISVGAGMAYMAVGFCVMTLSGMKGGVFR